jgi:hypothetical protein
MNEAARRDGVATHYYQSAGYNLTLFGVLMVVDVIALALRMLARRKQKQSLKADDWLTVPALILTFSSSAAMLSCEYFELQRT